MQTVLSENISLAISLFHVPGSLLRMRRPSLPGASPVIRTQPTLTAFWLSQALCSGAALTPSLREEALLRPFCTAGNHKDRFSTAQITQAQAAG